MKRPIAVIAALIAIFTLPGTVAASEQEDEVRSLVVDFNNSYLQNDLDRYFGYYADDATLWFNSGRSSLASYREGWYELIDSGGGVRKNTLSDIRIQMSPGGDAAIATYKVDVETESPDGEISHTLAHETDVWFRTDDGWRIAHVHYTAERGSE